MKNTFWDKRIPTLLGLLIITLGIAGTTLLVGQRTFFTQEASTSADPQEIRITNVTNSSFTVSYSTNSFVPGSLNFGLGNLTQTIIDDKDKNNLVDHKIHSFTIKNLSPSTKYSFNIVSGQNTYLNNGAAYVVETGPVIEAKKPSGFMVGKLTTLSGTPPKEAIVYATALGAAPASVVMKSDGSYTISFENLRTENLSSFFEFKSDSKIKILIISDSGTSKSEISAKDIINVPTIVISKDYNFTQEKEETATQSAQQVLFPIVANNKSQNTPKITSPSQDQTLSSTQPTFKGTGIPNDKIKIVIQSDPIEGEAVVDAKGNWTFKPATALSPGQHTITMTAKDSSGILRTITQTFTIQDAQAATVPSPSPSVSPTPTASPSASPSVSPTPTASPIVISTPTPIPTLPPTGPTGVSPGLMGLTLTAIGAFFFVLSRLLL